MKRHSIRTIVVAAVFASASGCVTNSTYDAMVAERDGLAQRADSLAADKVRLEAQVAQLDADRDALAASIEERDKKVADLSGTYEALVASLESELASGKVEIQQMRDGLRVNVADDVLFSSGSAQVDEHGQEVIAKVAAQLEKVANPIRVDGHTDDVPIIGALTTRYPTNWELAGARAASVVRLLADGGIEPARMQAISSGEFAPRASNEDDAGRARNRRIEIRLLPIVEGSEDVAKEATRGETPAAPGSVSAPGPRLQAPKPKGE